MDSESLRADLLGRIDRAANLEELGLVERESLGKGGAVAALLAGIPGLPREERPRAGRAANELKAEIQARLSRARERLEAEALERERSGAVFDPTLPAAHEPRGSLHPITQVTRELEDLFASMGCHVLGGPALVPRPRTHLLTYHGVLAPAAEWRDWIVPGEPRATPSDPSRSLAAKALRASSSSRVTCSSTSAALAPRKLVVTEMRGMSTVGFSCTVVRVGLATLVLPGSHDLEERASGWADARGSAPTHGGGSRRGRRRRWLGVSPAVVLRGSSSSSALHSPPSQCGSWERRSTWRRGFLSPPTCGDPPGFVGHLG